MLIFSLDLIIVFLILQDEDKMKKMNAKAGSTTKLAPQIQDLVKMIFDIDTLKKALVEFEVGCKKCQ